MRAYTASEIAKIVGGELLCGDGSIGITEFSTNSKEGDAATMFVPVIGERVDAHDFIGDAYAHGMRATFTCRKDVPVQCGADMACVYIGRTGEKNPNVAALQCFGAYVRRTFAVPVIGVTGSVGKTTTKEMVAAALETGLCTLKTAGNMNSQVGLPRMMCRLEEKHEIAVIEMGMSLPGEMERLVRVACPDCAVMTNIGVSHIGQLGSKENIRREKLNIINEFPEGGTLFLNADDPMLREVADAWRAVRGEKMSGAMRDDGQDGTVFVHGVAMDVVTAERFPHIRVVTYGTQEGCDYHAGDIHVVDERIGFRLFGGGADGLLVRLSVAGQHNVLNALAAFAVAGQYGIAAGQAAEGLSGYRPMAMRGGRINAGGLILIDDTYNASPDSMRGGIDSLMAVKAGRHIAVLADMLELGAVSKECHEQVGYYAAGRGVDHIVAIGQEAKYYAAAAQERAGRCAMSGENSGGETGCRTSCSLFEDNARALAFLREYVREGDAILFKGSRGMKLEELVAAFSTEETPQGFQDLNSRDISFNSRGKTGTWEECGP